MQLGRLPLLLPALGALAACRSADEWREHADEEVYGILAERRAELGATEPFSIEPPADPLRSQLLLAAAEGRSEPLTLDLVECLQVAAENSREWQLQRETLFREALDLTLRRWDLSWQVNREDPNAATAFVSGAGGEAGANGFLTNLNLFKLLGIGTRITADIGLDFLRDVGSGDGWDALSHLSLNITQPILRGFGSDIVEEPLTQAERDVLYQARRYERFRRTFAVEVAEGYFRVLEQVDQLANEEANYRNLTLLRERNEALAEAGRVDDIQLDQARQDELTAEDRLVAARRDLAGALDDFKFTLGLPIGTELTLEEGGLRSLEAWPALSEDLPESVAIALGLEKRLDHAIERDQAVDAARRVNVAADSLRTGLDLRAQSFHDSNEGQPASLRVDEVEWLLALDLDLPLDRIPERNVYRASLIDLQVSLRDVEASTDQVTSQLRDALRRLEAARASYRIQSGSVVLAGRRVESAALNLEAGRASTRDVLEAQESLLSAQNALAVALTDTILAGLFLYRDMELLEVSERGIEVLLLDEEGKPLAGDPEEGTDPEPEDPQPLRDSRIHDEP